MATKKTSKTSKKSVSKTPSKTTTNKSAPKTMATNTTSEPRELTVQEMRQQRDALDKQIRDREATEAKEAFDTLHNSLSSFAKHFTAGQRAKLSALLDDSGDAATGGSTSGTQTTPKKKHILMDKERTPFMWKGEGSKGAKPKILSEFLKSPEGEKLKAENKPLWELAE